MGGTHEFVTWPAKRGRWLSYSVGMIMADAIRRALLKAPLGTWTPAVEPDGEIRDSAWVTVFSGGLLDGRTKGMRLVVRNERPHSGAQLRTMGADGMRITCCDSDATVRSIAERELRLRPRAENRIRAARATGLRNLPQHDHPQDRVWLEIIQIALDKLAWTLMPGLDGKARLWVPCRLRFRLFSPAGQLVTAGRRQILGLARHRPSDCPIRATASGAVEPGAHPTRQSGRIPTNNQG